MGTFMKIVVVTIICFLFFACDSKEEPFNADKPYAIEITKERSLYQAEKLRDRLKDMGISTYIAKNTSNEDSSDEWFHILTGAEKKLEDVQDLRKKLSEKFNFKETKIIPYEDFKNANFDIKPLEKLELKRVNAQKPNVPETIYEVADKFPESNALHINKAIVINTPSDTANFKGYAPIYDISIDLPRGINKNLILKRTVSFIETIYSDNIYGDRVTIDIGKLRSKNLEMTSWEITEEYADLILNTGNYNFEEKKEIELNAWQKLIGHKVTIETKQDNFKTYLILLSTDREYLIFSQSTDKSLAELEKILKTIGKGQGLTSYDEFYNTFFTLPKNMVDDDFFIGFALNRLDWNYAAQKGYTQWSKLYVGHWTAKGYFYNNNKGIWTYGIFDLLTKEKNKLGQELYEKETANRSNDVIPQQIGDINGFAVYENKFNWNTYKSYKKINEINWIVNRYVSMINNTENSWFSKEELLKRAESLQTM